MGNPFAERLYPPDGLPPETLLHTFWKPQIFIPSIGASIIACAIALILAVSFGALMFQGRLAPYAGAGISMIMVSAIVLCLVNAIFGLNHSIISYPQSTAVAVQAAMVTRIVASAPPTFSDEALFHQVMITIILSSILTGFCFFILGSMRTGDLIRYIPYPVIGGFLAGSGWLLLQGALDMMIGLRLQIDTLPLLFTLDVFLHWGPSVLFGLFIVWLLRRTDNMLLLPVMLIGLFVVFYALMLGAGYDLKALTDAHWLLDGFGAGVGWQMVDFSVLSQIDWSLIITQTGNIVAVVILSTLNLLLNSSGLEFIVKKDINLNNQLTITGTGNMTAAFLGGGAIGFPSVTLSTIVHRMGAHGRFVGIMLALLLGVTLVSGGSFIGLFPRLVLGSLLMYLGFSFLIDWLYDGWFKLPLKDYIVMLIIVLVIALLGILEGVAVGFLATTILFVLDYSKISVIKQELFGNTFRSNIDRSYVENQLLQELGQHIWAMRLHGFIFFGTSHQLIQRIQKRIQDPEQEAYLYIILDFEHVGGIDTSAVVDLTKLDQMAELHGFRLITTGVSKSLQETLLKSGFRVSGSEFMRQFEDLDHAMEWCENDLLSHANPVDIRRTTLQEEFVKRTTASIPMVVSIMDYLEELHLEAGVYLAHQHDDPDVMYFIESGRVEIYLEVNNQKSVRLRSFSAGTIVGEVGFYLGKPRSASIVVTESGVFYRLTRSALRKMEKENPATASAFHVFVICVLSERLSLTNSMIQGFMT